MRLFTHIFAAATAALLAASSMQAAIPVEVRKNTEFFSAVARTAGAKEYINNSYKDYAARIDSAAAQYKNHPAIELFNRIRNRHGFGYDAIASFGLSLDVSGNKVRFNPDFDHTAMLDRITSEEADSLIPLLDDFYRAIDFDRIYEESTPMYNKAMEAFNRMQTNVDFDWLSHYYGFDYNALTAGLSFLNFGNYGMTERRKDGNNHSFMLIGTQTKKGEPDYSGCESLLIHEGSHPISNSLIEKLLPQLNSNSDSIAKHFAAELHSQAYAGATTVLCETMVRTAEARYALDHIKSQNDSIRAWLRIRHDKTNGFLFIEDFVKALDRYEANRDKYPTLADFMPELAKVHNSLDVDSIISDIRARQPQFVSCNIADNAILPPGLTKITIRFNQPIIYGQGLAPFNGREFPDSEDSSTSWNDDRTEFTYTVTLKPSTKYGIMYPGIWFKSRDCYNTIGTYLLPFETSAE